MTVFVNMYAKCRQIEDAQRMFNRMPERDLVAWNAIISGYARNGLAKRVFEFVFTMQREGKRPDSITLVRACADVGSLRIGRVINGYTISAGFELLVNVSTAFMDMYAKCGLIGIARLVFDRM
ncbi:hypothetical protein AAC387_Pa07g0510 [Persea americana]